MSGLGDWKCIQFFGEQSPNAGVSDEDVISALSFDTTGDYIALGDKAGRMIIFKNMHVNSKHDKPEYEYLTELQSHIKEYDKLKSKEIDEKINDIQWMRPQGGNIYILSTNDKTVKLWKICEKTMKRAVPVKTASGAKDLKLPRLEEVERGYIPSLREVYPHLHDYSINSISICSDGESFISADDLTVNLWNIERTMQTFNLVNLKPPMLDELSEVITAANFHPTNNNLIVVASSTGILRVADFRVSSQCEKTAKIFAEPEDPSTKNFFTEIICSLSDAIFSNNGKYIFSRDFLSLKVWDLANTKQPVASIPIFEPLKSKLCEVYENECIFDKFTVSSSPCSNYILTGLFNDNFHVIDRTGEKNTQFELNYGKKCITKQIPKKYFENLGPGYNFDRKILKSAWHPTKNTVAVACLNSLFFYGI
jgi:serine/threonine-protein phosphatase 2A regulatory subunit B